MANINSNVKQLITHQDVILTNDLEKTINVKNYNTLVIHVEVSGLRDLQTLKSFDYLTFNVKGLIGDVVDNILPDSGIGEGMKKSGAVNNVQIIKNGTYKLVFDVSKYTSIKIKRGLVSQGAVYSAKMVLIDKVLNPSIVKKIKFNENVNVVNFKPSDNYLKINITVSGIGSSTTSSVKLNINEVEESDDNFLDNNLKAIEYPLGTIMNNINGGVTFEKDGNYELRFKSIQKNFLRIYNTTTAGVTFKATAEYVDNILEVHQTDTIESTSISRTSLVINTYDCNYLKINISESILESVTNFLGYNNKTSGFTDTLDIYSYKHNAVFGAEVPYYHTGGVLKDVLIIPTRGIDKIWVQNNALKNSIVEKLDTFKLKEDITIHFKYTEINNNWAYKVPKHRTLCELFGGDISDFNYLKIDYNYIKGYTNGLDISPTFKQEFENTLNRPQKQVPFYDFLGNRLIFSDTNLRTDYTYQYAKLIHNSKGLYYIETNGEELDSIGINLQGFVTGNNANPFTCEVKLSVSKKANFYKPKTINKNTFVFEEYNFKDYFFFNSTRYGKAHAFQGANSIYVSSDSARYYKIDLNSTNFPNLPVGASNPILYILPCDWNENAAYALNMRLCVIIGGKVYHNYPTSYVNTLSNADKELGIAKFEESNIWDLPVRCSIGTRADISVRKLPSKLTEAEISNLEGNLKYIYKYYPVLPDEMYNADGTYKYSKTSNSEPFKEIWDDKSGLVVFPRYYNKNGADNASMFYSMMYPAVSSKMTLLGHYFTTTSDRAVVLGTSDGGANWYVKFDFASYQNTDPFTITTPKWGNQLKTTNIGEAYTPNSLEFGKLTFTVPTEENKEPSTKFVLSPLKPIVDITVGNSAIVSCVNHGINTRDIIYIKTSSGYSGNWRCLANNNITVNNGGNGTLFVANKIDNDKFEIREYIHSIDHNITARHVHHVNDAKDGFIVSSGEQYPDGSIVFLKQQKKDQPVGIKGSVEMPFYRLNSTVKSVQRASGFIMLDDDSVNPTCLFGCDESDIIMPSVTIEGRTNLFSKSSTGIFKGKLSDIDDLSKWKCVLPCDEMILSLRAIGTVIIASGMRNGLYVSRDKGESWEMIQMNNRMMQMGFDDSMNFYLNNGRIVL